MKLFSLGPSKLIYNFRGHKPLSRTYFAVKLPNSNDQSIYFNSLSIWLIGLCGGAMSGDKKYDDPLTMATNLLTEMKVLGIECDIPPNKLRTVNKLIYYRVMVRVFWSYYAYWSTGLWKRKNSGLKKCELKMKNPKKMEILLWT